MTTQKSVITNKNPEHKMDTLELALGRTVMATDRTLIAWIRIGLSLISFGFTIYKFLDYPREQLIASGKTLDGISSPKIVGLFMVAMGIVSLIFGIIENISSIKILRGRFSFKRTRYALLMALMIISFRLIIFLGIIFKVRGLGTT